MSFDVELMANPEGELVKVERHEEGGTYVLGGIEEAELNITYNYSWFYFRFLDEEKGLRWLNEMRAQETIERLEAAVEILGTNKFDDYWAPTPGNAGHALNILLGWAKQHLAAFWSVD